MTRERNALHFISGGKKKTDKARNALTASDFLRDTWRHAQLGDKDPLTARNCGTFRTAVTLRRQVISPEGLCVPAGNGICFLGATSSDKIPGRGSFPF